MCYLSLGREACPGKALRKRRTAAPYRLRCHLEEPACCAAGHSLGGALASLCAFDLAWSKIGRLGDQQSGDLIPVTAFTFEAPRVGEQKQLSALVLLLDDITALLTGPASTLHLV